MPDVIYAHCTHCGRRLKSPESMEAGYGPSCYRKLFGKSLPRQAASGAGGYRSNHSAVKRPESVGAVGPLFLSDIICSRSPDGSAKVNIQQRIVCHSPGGFEWGYSGSGPSDLALNILSMFIGQEAAERGGLYQHFKEHFITPMPRAGGTIKKEAILNWIAEQEKQNATVRNDKPK